MREGKQQRQQQRDNLGSVSCNRQPACTVITGQPAQQGSQEGLNIAESDKVDHRNQRTCKASEKDRLRMSDIYCTTYVYATTPKSVIIGHA